MNFAGGSIELDVAESEKALSTEIGEELAMDAQTAAYGVVEVVDENMANAARVHAVENGEDLANYTMIAFGGAAPLHAARLCEKLGVDRLLVPLGAGVGSAIGFLRAPFSFEANRSVYMRLSQFDSSLIKNLFTELRDEAIRFVRRCDSHANIESEFKVYMRYSGQGWEIPVVLNEKQAMHADMKTFKRLFEDDYRALFGRIVDGMDIEITVWAVNATTPSAEVQLAAQTQSSGLAPTDAKRSIFDSALGETRQASIVQRSAMRAGQVVHGPAAITEDETTIIVPTSREAIVHKDGCLDLTVREN